MGFLDGSILPVLAVPGKPVEPGLFQAGLAGFADGLTAPFVFVIGRDVSDAGVEPYRVVLRPGGGEFGAQRGRVADREQVRVLGLDVPVEAFDPGLVGGGVRPAEVLGDRAQGEELPGRAGGHLRAVEFSIAVKC